MVQENETYDNPEVNQFKYIPIKIWSRRSSGDPNNPQNSWSASHLLLQAILGFCKGIFLGTGRGSLPFREGRFPI